MSTLSKVPFSEQELQFLNEGYKFNIKNVTKGDKSDIMKKSCDSCQKGRQEEATKRGLRSTRNITITNQHSAITWKNVNKPLKKKI